MRILHTADWHLGQTFHNFDRTLEHEQFLSWLLDTIVKHQVDALVVAGDVFDSANPPIEAQRLYYRFLFNASQRHPDLNIVVTAGNHDSPGRLEAPRDLLRSLRVHVVGTPQFDAAGNLLPESVVVPIESSARGPLGWCVAMPFLRGVDGEDPVANIYSAALNHIQTLSPTPLPVVATAHAHFSGGNLSGTERTTLVGGLETLSANLFNNPHLSYVALGHLHYAQTLANRPNLRYSGSPIPLSFTETDYAHSVVVADLAPGACAQVQQLPIPRAVDLIRLPHGGPGAPDDVLAQLKALELPERGRDARPFLEVRVRLTEPRPDMRARVEEALEGKSVRLAKLDVSYCDEDSADTGGAPLVTVQSLKPEQVLERLYAQKFQQAVPKPIADAFTELLANVNIEE
jgi:exonuclease SbcD